jgi:Arc/MetJ family transcription regulator
VNGRERRRSIDGAFCSANGWLDLYIRFLYSIYTLVEGISMAVTLTSIRLDTHLADEAVKVLGVKSRTEAVHVALREVVALKRFKDLMRKNAGKLSFAAHGE